MTYELAFDRRALKEWQKLGHTIREQFKKKLAERLENPRVPAARLHGHADRYKIKLRASGYRLACHLTAWPATKFLKRSVIYHSLLR